MKIKFDTSGADPEKAAAAGNFESPKPGIYEMKIIDAVAGFSKGENGQPDKSRARLEVVYSCLDARYKGAQVWEYISLPGSTAFNDMAQDKMLQLLMAVGHSDGKKNRKGELDIEKVLKGKVVKVRVRAGVGQDGETYRGEFGSVFPADADAGGMDDSDLSDDDELAVDDELDGDDYDWDARQGELSQMSVPDLKSIAKEMGIELKGKTKSTLVDAILEAEQSSDQEGDDDDIADDDDEIIEEDDVIEEDATEYLTREQLLAMDNKELVATAKEFDINPKDHGSKKSLIIDAILEAQAAPEGDEDAPPF